MVSENIPRIIWIWFGCVAACFVFESCKYDHTPPVQQKYKFKRTPGEVSHIVGHLFVDTGATTFLVRGKGFDPLKSSNYILFAQKCLSKYPVFGIHGTDEFNSISAGRTAFLQHITDTTIAYTFKQTRLFNSYFDPNTGAGGCPFNDSARLCMVVRSIDSINIKNLYYQYDILKNITVKNQLFYTLENDTLYWFKNKYLSKGAPKSISLTLQHTDHGFVNLYFNDSLIRPQYYVDELSPTSEDWGGYYLFDKHCYDKNASKLKGSGYYNVKVIARNGGEVLKERHGKTSVYVKFIE